MVELNDPYGGGYFATRDRWQARKAADVEMASAEADAQYKMALIAKQQQDALEEARLRPYEDKKREAELDKIYGESRAKRLSNAKEQMEYVRQVIGPIVMASSSGKMPEMAARAAIEREVLRAREQNIITDDQMLPLLQAGPKEWEIFLKQGLTIKDQRAAPPSPELFYQGNTATQKAWDPDKGAYVVVGSRPTFAPGVNINMPAGETAFAKESGKLLAQRKFEIVGSGERAANALPQLSQLGDLMSSGVKTGPASSITLPLRAFARDVGVDVDAVAESLGVPLGDVVSQEDFERLSAQVIIDGFEKFKGNLNEKEVGLAMNSFGNLGRSEEANISAIAAAMAAAELAAEDGARAVQAGTSNDLIQLATERARRGTDKFKQLKSQYESQIKSARPAAAEKRGEAPAGVPPDLWEVMTPEERAAWQK